MSDHAIEKDQKKWSRSPLALLPITLYQHLLRSLAIANFICFLYGWGVNSDLVTNYFNSFSLTHRTRQLWGPHARLFYLLVNENDSFALQPNTCAKNKFASHCYKKRWTKIIIFFIYIELYRIGYSMCSKYLKKKFVCAEFLWLSRCPYHFLGKYNCKGAYMVHLVYICSNLRSPFIKQKYDQLEGCNSYNHVMLSSPLF